MAGSKQISEIREYLDKARNSETNVNYYIRNAIDELTSLDEYLSTLEQTVNVMSTRLAEGK